MLLAPLTKSGERDYASVMEAGKIGRSHVKNLVRDGYIWLLDFEVLSVELTSWELGETDI